MPLSVNIYAALKTAFLEEDRPMLLKHAGMPLYRGLMEKLARKEAQFFLQQVYAAHLRQATLSEQEGGRWHQISVEVKSEIGPRVIIL